MSEVNILVEGITDEAVARSLFYRKGISIEASHGLKGKPHLLKNLDRYNRAAEHSCWFVMVDLDRDTNCVLEFIAAKLPKASNGMHFRVVVRELEAWLLADREAFSQFFYVPISKIPAQPEIETDPKQALINCVARSGKKSIRKAMVPRPNSGATEGPLYSSTIRDYVRMAWRPEIAALNSRSLDGAIRAIDKIAKNS